MEGRPHEAFEVRVYLENFIQREIINKPFIINKTSRNISYEKVIGRSRKKPARRQEGSYRKVTEEEHMQRYAYAGDEKEKLSKKEHRVDA